jgi:hypothetical protein
MTAALPISTFRPMLPETRRRGRRGMGDQKTAQLGVQVGTLGAGAGTAALVAAHLIPASAVPFIGPAIAGAALLAAYLIKNSGCGQTCIQTSAWANQAADALQKNLDAYFAQPVRTRASQVLALQTFDQLWAKLMELCGDPQWGDAGKRCISDRQQGACKWKQIYQPAYAGQPQIGECFNWFNGYRDPIAQDTGVVDEQNSDVASSVLSSIGLPAGKSNVGLLLLAGLALVAVMS